MPVTSVSAPQLSAVETLALQRKVDFLCRPDSYPEGSSSVELVQTHACYVFLTDRFVYKLKKPVQRAFLDFRTLAARRHDCEEETRLNRRLAPDVYLGIVPLCLSPRAGLQLGGEGEIVEWLVHMRRLPTALMLDHAIRRGAVSTAAVEAFTAVLTDYYRRSHAVELGPEDYRLRYRRDVEASRNALVDADYGLDRQQIEDISQIQLEVLDIDAPLFARRVRAGRIIDCHGDLRPEHVCTSEPPVFIDCLEFKREFRLLDPVDELSYLALECEYQGAPSVGETVLEFYRERMPDPFPARLADFHKAYRGTLRAKLAAWHLQDGHPAERSHWLSRARDYLALAAHYCGRL